MAPPLAGWSLIKLAWKLDRKTAQGKTRLKMELLQAVAAVVGEYIRAAQSGRALAPQQQPCEPGQHKRGCAWFGHVVWFGQVGKRDCDAQIVGDGLRPERVTEEGIVASLEAMRRSLCRKCINIGQRVASVEDA